MSGKSIIFNDEKIKKINFYKSKKEAYCTKKLSKYFIGYNDNDVIRPLCTKLSQMIGCVKCFDSNKTTLFKASDNKLLKKYTKIQEKVSSLMSIKFDSEPVYGDNDKYIKTKIMMYGDNVNTNFHGKKIPKENTSCKCE